MLTHRRVSDDGFSFVEIVIAIGLLSILISVLGQTVASNLRPILLSKQRVVATAVAQQVLEQARSLNYTDVGMVSTDSTIATDSNIISGKYNNEALAYATNTVNHPFTPHYVASFKLNSTMLTKWVWVTQCTNAGCPSSGNVRRVTVRIKFENPGVATSSTNLRRNYVRSSTLISSAKYTDAGVPLTSATTADPSRNEINSLIGLTASPDKFVVNPASVCATDCGLTATGVRNQMACSGSTVQLDHSTFGGSTFGGTKVSSVSDDDPATTATTGSTQTGAAQTGSPPSDIYNANSTDPAWLTQSSLGGSATCQATVLGPDGAPGGAGDDDLPYERGTTAGPSQLTLMKHVQSAAPEIAAPMTVLDRIDANTSTPDGETTNNVDVATAAGCGTPVTSNCIIATSVQRTPDIRALGFDMPTTVPALSAPYGLLRVEPITLTATAVGKTSGTAPTPTVTASSATPGNLLRIWLYDPLNLLGSTCTSRSSTPAGYCIVDHSVTSSTPLTPIVLDETITGPAGIRVAHWIVQVQESAPAITTQTASRGTTWTAQTNPLVAVATLCIADINVPTCTPDGLRDQTKPEALDIGVSVNLGTTKAQAVYGFPA